MAKDIITVSPTSVKSGTNEQLYFMFEHSQLSMDLRHKYTVVFVHGDRKTGTKVIATKINIHTLMVRLPKDLSPGTTLCTVISYKGIRLGDVNLEVLGATEYLADVLDSVADPLKYMCNAADVKDQYWNSLDERLSSMGKAQAPPLGFEKILGADQSTTEEDTISPNKYPTALHFAAKYGLSRLCLRLLTWPGASQAAVTMNRNGETPSTLARRTGHTTLAEQLDDFVEDEMEDYEYTDPELAKRIFKTKDPRGRYVKLVQFIEQHKHLYTNVDGREHELTVPLEGDESDATERTDDDLDAYAYVHLDDYERLRRSRGLRSLVGPRSIMYIDSKGGKLQVTDPKLALTIPPDSVARGIIKEITVGVCWIEDYPPIEADQMVMGPIVRCGPDGMAFDKDVHMEISCPMLDLKLKSVQVWCNEKSIAANEEWTKVYDGNQPNHSSMKVNLVGGSLIFSTRHFSRFSFLLRRRKVDRKILIFLTPIDIADTQYVYVKIYAVREDKEKEIKLEESRYGGHECAIPSEFEIKANRKDLRITLTNVDNAWEIDGESENKEIGYKCLQKGGVTSKCVFTLNKTKATTRTIRGSLKFEQDGNGYVIKDLKFDLIFVPKHLRPSGNPRGNHPSPPPRTDSTRGKRRFSFKRVIQDVVPDSRGSYSDHHVSKASPTERQLDPETHYHMAVKTKGLAIIINILTFPARHQRRRPRTGSDIDLSNMIHLFKELGYEVKSCENLTAKDIVRRIKDFANRLNSSEASYNSAVIVLMSHGESGIIYGTDEEQVAIKDIQEEFNGKNCPRMKGKPKLFFIQSCRGTNQMLSPVVTDGNDDDLDDRNDYEEMDEESNQQQETTDDSHSHTEPQGTTSPSGGGSGDADMDVNVLMEDVPENADMHLAYATTDGYLSLRNETEGSWFVQALSEVFLARAHEDSLDEMMNQVTDYVASLKGRLYDPRKRHHVFVRQSPERVNRMRKTLYFLPGYPP